MEIATVLLRRSVWTGLLLLHCSVACGRTQSDREQGTTKRSAVRDLLVDELRRAGRAAQYPFDIDASDVSFGTQGSSVVPGLVYEWATFRSHAVSHGFLWALAGSSAQGMRIIRDSSDWFALVGRWRPQDGEAAVRACAEAVFRSPSTNPDLAWAVYRTGTILPPGLRLDDVLLLPGRIGPPASVRADLNDGIWRVDMWVINPSLYRVATRYDCRFPAAEQGTSQEVQVAVIDSIMRAGFSP